VSLYRPRVVRELAPVAARSARAVCNTPDVAAYVDAQVLGWVLRWDPTRDLSVRSYIARKAANEARRLRALSVDERREIIWRRMDEIIRKHKAIKQAVRPKAEVCVPEE
jgi:hypothetical protein